MDTLICTIISLSIHPSAPLNILPSLPLSLSLALISSLYQSPFIYCPSLALPPHYLSFSQHCFSCHIVYLGWKMFKYKGLIVTLSYNFKSQKIFIASSFQIKSSPAKSGAALSTGLQRPSPGTGRGYLYLVFIYLL